MIDMAFYKLVEEMRNAQKEYFKTKSTHILQNAKHLESQVDKLIKLQSEPKLDL